MSVEAPYGAWSSPIGVELLTAGQVGLGDVLFDDADAYWLESRADQGGRTSLWRESAGERLELTPDRYVRTLVHEYGGGSFHVKHGVVVYSSFPDARVWKIDGDGDPVQLTDGSKRYAAFRVEPDLGIVLAICEDPTSSASEPVASVVALDLSDGSEIVLATGADFYSGVVLGPDGRIAWCEWDHPNMPWDTTCIRAGQLVSRRAHSGDPEFHDPFEVIDAVTVAYTEDVSVGYPEWLPDGRLVFLSDESGFWNFQVFDGESTTPLHFHPFDFCGPAWVLDRGPFAILDSERILCSWLENGVARLGVLTEGRLERLATDQVSVAALSVSHPAGATTRVLALLGYATRPRAIVEIDLTTSETRTLRSSSSLEIDLAYFSTAQPISVGMPLVHAWYYPPTNPDYHAPTGELPPLRVLSHGGPTAFAAPALRLDYQYWTSRGYAIVDVNYGGSTGYGRDYRERLKGQWGLVDVADCVTVAREVTTAGLGDPARTYIEGGSAGGYTTLRALTSDAAEVFAAGISYFGVGDLAALARDTHKFESRYLDGLVGPWPEDEATYAERSPLQHLDRLAAPMLILQGTEDKIVPPNQAQEMAAAVRAKGLRHALLLFEGEGHGFRKAETIQRSLEASQSFLGQVFGFTPADPIDPLALD